ncbi:potassium-transporting ATPase subunit KdpB [Catenulispora sp. NL8]|uniref:Potassium-transporting ATPase ATP-binding subunit n=1 Tax=Catenulispora pinistramenti TaxID=2705254 RepID=A0ABS5L6R0_9ACTN|nr:potassium-transporting ATPase subunit KdpB [Catenulispora pinistramenti]MBS2554023.1 potassium-transporting ATPase subunit KdpB [Catenulispora pinistramenti]
MQSQVLAGRAPRVGAGALRPGQLASAVPEALRKLDPRRQVRMPVMFVTEVGAALTTVLALWHGGWFGWLITVWLWLTVVFANLAEAVAESRGRAQADSLRRTRQQTNARKLIGWRLGAEVEAQQVAAEELRRGDHVVVEAGQLIPGDGDVVEGVASVDESAITGESAPVIRESGGDRSAVTGGTRVLSDRIVVEITSDPGRSFLDRMIALVEGAQRRKTPNELALNLLLVALTFVFLVAVVTLQPMAIFSKQANGATPVSGALTANGVTGVVLVGLLVCLIPTTIGALLSAIGIAGMDRMVQRNVLAMSGRAVEAAGDVHTLLLDKTGTITFGNRQASDFHPIGGAGEDELAEAALLASLADETPEGRSIVEFARRHYGFADLAESSSAELVPFSATTRMSGVDLTEPKVRQLRKGAARAIANWVRQAGGTVPRELEQVVDQVSETGSTPLAVAECVDGKARVLGVIQLKDVVKPGLAARFAELRTMGIKTVMITGDNPVTAKAIAAEAGVDEFMAEATPEQKLARIKAEQAEGKLVAMTGDGTNDAPALAQADVGVAMNTGTSAAKEAGNMVDLDSDPTKIIEIVEIGKQLLITRGALTAFSIANDVAKYFAILPAMFGVVYPGLKALNVMGLHSAQSAIMSAVVFNALIIVALIPLALRGVRYRPAGASALLTRNLWVYGLGGLIAPFIAIKALDLCLVRFLPGM